MSDFDELTIYGANRYIVFAWRTILFAVGFAATAILTIEILYISKQIKKYGAISTDPYIRKVSDHDARSYALLIGAVASMWGLIAMLYGRVQGKPYEMRAFKRSLTVGK